jgi:hypothetical protein
MVEKTPCFMGFGAKLAIAMSSEASVMLSAHHPPFDREQINWLK